MRSKADWQKVAEQHERRAASLRKRAGYYPAGHSQAAGSLALAREEEQKAAAARMMGEQR